MTGPEHYAEAEKWAYKAKHSSARGGPETDMSCAAIAQVHATLALAAATGLCDGAAGYTHTDYEAWFAVATSDGAS